MRFILAIVAVLAMAGCGESGSPAATPLPSPPPNVHVEPAVWAYLAEICVLGDEEPETWGDVVATMQEFVDFVEDRPAPREVRDFFETQIPMVQMGIAHAKQRDQSAEFEIEDEAWQALRDEPDMLAARAVVNEAHAAMDRDVIDAVSEAGC